MPADGVAREVFAVGDGAALAGLPEVGGALEVLAPSPVGRIALAEAPAGGVALDPGDAAPWAAEAIALGARVAQKNCGATTLRIIAGAATDEAALRADGFAPDGDGGWSRPADVPFTRAGARAHDPDDVYADPLSIPWNFVRAEADAYPMLLGAPPRRVLEIGCGHAKNTRVLHAHGHEVVATDISPRAIERCRRFAPESATYAVADAADLPFADASFDVLLDIGCLHCMPADARPAAVAEARRVLRPGGALVSRIFTPKDARWVSLQPFAADAFGLPDDAVRGLLEDDFEIEEWRRDAGAHYLTCRPRERAAAAR
ncbi:MAG TPA: class I SAM-dependent methyltransferase [Solirubrobacteraceae bacterium]